MTPEVDLEGWLAARLGAGDLLDVEGVLVDREALARRRHACRPRLCTPGVRAPGIVSCCADIDVPITAKERRAIERRLPIVREAMASRDPRWASRVPALFRAGGSVLARPRGRCVFACETARGLRCGLHTAAEASGLPVAALKPSPCRLFPLVVLRHRGRTILTATTGEVSAALGGPPDAALACIACRGDGKGLRAPRLFEACQAAIVEGFGAAFYERLAVRLLP